MKQELQSLEGARINNLRRESDLIIIDFTSIDGVKVSLHSLCSLRIFVNDKLIVSSWDMTKRGKRAKGKFDWEKPFTSKFDDELEANIDLIRSGFIKSAIYNNNDLYIDLENGARLEFLLDTVASEEKYKFSIMS